MTTNEIELLISEALPGAIVVVESDDGVHFNAAVTWQGFADKTLLERQRMVLAPIQQYINDGTIHAFSVKTIVNG